jgi:hypothetical protein
MPDQQDIKQEQDPSRNQLWDVIQTFSNEAQNAAKRKASEQGYSFERAEIPFEETLINLSHCRDVLVQAIESTAIIQVPLKIQRQMLSDVTKVSTQLQALVNGIDAVVPFTSAVDDLVSTVWYSRIEDIHGEVLGLQIKLNQLKVLERSLRELDAHAQRLQNTEKAAEEVIEKLGLVRTRADASLGEIQTKQTESEKLAAAAKESEQRATASLAVTQQAEKSLAESSVAARNTAAELEAFKQKADIISKQIDDLRAATEKDKTDLAQFRVAFESGLEADKRAFSQVFGSLEESGRREHERLTKDISDRSTQFKTQLDTVVKAAVDTVESNFTTLKSELQNADTARNSNAAAQLVSSRAAFETESNNLQKATKDKLNAVEATAGQIVETNGRKTEERFQELEKLENQIRDKILLATNYQLFHAFQTRQLTIAKSVNFWKYALFSCVGISFTATLVLIGYLIWGRPTYNAAFFLKLGFTLPIIYAVHFCSTQYSKERQLEEEYAFKGNISISLEPYRELVEKMVDKGNTADATKYLDFVLTSIDRVFTPPATSSNSSRERAHDLAEEAGAASTGLSKILGAVTDLVQSVAKLK